MMSALLYYHGHSLPKLSYLAKENSLKGLEFCCGIPGNIGGAVKMNAGAYGGEVSQVLESCKYLDENGNVKTIKNEDMKFSYRHSIFIENPKWVILEATFKLSHGDKNEIEKIMSDNMLARKTKQPLEYHSAGSVFRRPPGYFVGKLVQDSGLRGKNIGGAYVSEKHTGFIINKGEATCKDILDLIKYVQDTVYEKFNVYLQTEIEFVGREMK